MKKTYFSGALAALALAAPGAAFAQATPAAAVIVIDRNKIANECNACRVALGQLQGLINQLATRRNQLIAPLQTEGQAIRTSADAAAKLPAGPARQKAEADIQRRLATYQQNEQRANQELGGLDQNIQSIRAHLMDQIMTRLDPIVNNVMRTRAASIAIDKSDIIQASPALDVTTDVMNQFNTQVTTLSFTPLPQPAAPAATVAPPAAAQPPGR